MQTKINLLVALAFISFSCNHLTKQGRLNMNPREEGSGHATTHRHADTIQKKGPTHTKDINLADECITKLIDRWKKIINESKNPIETYLRVIRNLKEGFRYQNREGSWNQYIPYCKKERFLEPRHIINIIPESVRNKIDTAIKEIEERLTLNYNPVSKDYGAYESRYDQIEKLKYLILTHFDDIIEHNKMGTGFLDFESWKGISALFALAVYSNSTKLVAEFAKYYKAHNMKVNIVKQKLFNETIPGYVAKSNNTNMAQLVGDIMRDPNIIVYTKTKILMDSQYNNTHIFLNPISSNMPIKEVTDGNNPKRTKRIHIAQEENENKKKKNEPASSIPKVKICCIL